MELVEKAIKALNLNVSMINPVTESYSSIVRILELEDGKRVVLKIPFTREKLLREEKVLNLLKLNPLVPELLDIWGGDESSVGALLLSYIDGEPMSLPASENVIYEMGKALAMIHSVKINQFELDDVEEDWCRSVRCKVEGWVSEIRNSISQSMLLKIDKFLNEYVMTLNQVDGPCLVHFDYRPGNILVRNGKVVGVIDFESSRGGSAEIDFTKVSNQIWSEYPASKKIFLDGYQSTRELPKLDEVLPIYSFYHAVGGITWCVRREKLDDPFFQENLSALESILSIY